MKNLIVLLLIFISVNSFGQNPGSAYIPQETSLLKENQVKKLKISFATLEGKKKVYGIYEYDKKGQLIYESEQNFSKSPHSFNGYCYDNQGRKIKSTHTQEITAINYCEGDSTMSSSIYIEGDSIIDTLIDYAYYRYNENSQTVSIHRHNENKDQLMYSIEHTFDGKGDKIKSKSTGLLHTTGVHINYYSYSYENGLVATKSVFSDSNHRSLGFKTFFQYDTKKQITKQMVYEFNIPYEGDSILGLTITSRYHPNGQLKSETVTEYDTFLFKKWSHKRAFESKITTTYDKDGLTTSELNFNKKDKLISGQNWAYEYYPNGLLKSQQQVLNSEKEYGKIIYEYIFY